MQGRRKNTSNSDWILFSQKRKLIEMEMKFIIISLSIMFINFVMAQDQSDPNKIEFSSGQWNYTSCLENKGLRKEFFKSSSLTYRGKEIPNFLGTVIVTPIGSYRFELYSKFDENQGKGWVPLVWNSSSQSYQKFRSYHQKLIKNGKLKKITTTEANTAESIDKAVNGKTWLKGSLDQFISDKWIYTVDFGYWVDPGHTNLFLEYLERHEKR